MRKSAFLLLLLLFTVASAQEKGICYYGVGFYNLENLFDTIHDAGKNDYEFLPDGKYKWGTLKYTNKLKNMAKVLGDMGTDVSATGMALVGVSEVENSRVLKDLVVQEPLAKRKWGFLHVESNDQRGVDCAVLYNPALFKPVTTKLVPYVAEYGDTVFYGRGFLVVSGYMGGEMVHAIVSHWPSRYSKSPVRERVGRQVRQLKDSLMNANPCAKVIVMGDMNDNPDNKSLSVSLGAVREAAHLKRNSDLYNPWWNILRNEGRGTHEYNDKWSLFDQIILSAGMVGPSAQGLKFHKAEIFSRNYLFQEKGRYKGRMKRTHAGGIWLNGYSDHLPVIVYLMK